MSGSRVKPLASDGEPPKPPLRGRRALQADQTRRDILEAARHRFAARGYAATTLKDIAAKAGVSVQTVYDSIGSKPELMRRLNDLVDDEAGIADIAAGLPLESDPLAVVAIPARITRRLVERCGDILRAGLAAGLSEPDLLPLVAEGQRRHRAGADAVARRLDSLGALRPGLTAATAGKTLAALADFRLALVLTEELGMDGDGLQEWMADTAARAVLGSPASSGS